MYEVSEQESLRDLIARLIDSGKAYARAEVALIRQTVVTRIGQIKPAIALAIPAIFIIQAALTVLLVALGFVLARWLGPAGGMAAAAAIGLIVAGLLIWFSIRLIAPGKRA